MKLVYTHQRRIFTDTVFWRNVHASSSYSIISVQSRVVGVLLRHVSAPSHSFQGLVYTYGMHSISGVFSLVITMTGGCVGALGLGIIVSICCGGAFLRFVGGHWGILAGLALEFLGLTHATEFSLTCYLVFLLYHVPLTYHV